MIEALQKNIFLTTPSSAGFASPSPVATVDVQRFRAALGGSDTEPAAVQVLPLTGTALSAVNPVNAPVTAGDAILTGLKAASSDISQAWLQATQAASQPSMSTAQMLGVQATLLQASVHFELLSKGITKTTQSLDQILKTQ